MTPEQLDALPEAVERLRAELIIYDAAVTTNQTDIDWSNEIMITASDLRLVLEGLAFNQLEVARQAKALESRRLTILGLRNEIDTLQEHAAPIADIGGHLDIRAVKITFDTRTYFKHPKGIREALHRQLDHLLGDWESKEKP